jgi:hypothetical protein
MKNIIIYLNFERSSILVFKLAVLCSQHLVTVSDRYFGEEDGVGCLMHGLVSSRSWFIVDCNEIQIKIRNLYRIGSVANEIREKKLCRGEDDDLMHKELSGNYFKNLGEVCNVTFASACFLKFSNTNQYQ